MHERQNTLNGLWREEELPEFGLGIGLSTGDVAAALLGSEERIEYTLVGDTVNLAQRLQDLARPAGTTVLSAPTVKALREPPSVEPMGEQHVKGREGAVSAFRLLTSNGAPSSLDNGG
jgi:class 3 adenylate cyclase